MDSEVFGVFMDEKIEDLYETIDDMEAFALEGNLLMVKSLGNEAIKRINELVEYISKHIMIGEK